MTLHNFNPLFAEFIESHWSTAEAIVRRQRWLTVRDDARARWSRIVALRAKNLPYADALCEMLLPYADTETNRTRGRWIHPASTLSLDVRPWFERERWAIPADWPVIAYALVETIERALLSPEKLQDICNRFTQHRETRGFQSSLISPIFNALVPDHFHVANAATHTMLRALIGVPWSMRIETYPKVNEAIEALLEQHHEQLTAPIFSEHRPGDVLCLFAQWLVTRLPNVIDEPWDSAQRDSTDTGAASVPAPQCWKVTPGEQTQRWFKCLADESIAFGWPLLDDLSAIDRVEFDARLTALTMIESVYYDAVHLWQFSRAPVGTYVIAVRGSNHVVGIGRITSAYQFVENAPNPHRMGVDWFDTTERKCEQPGWQQLLCPVDVRWFENTFGLASSVMHVRVEELLTETTGSRSSGSNKIADTAHNDAGVVLWHPAAYVPTPFRLDPTDSKTFQQNQKTPIRSVPTARQNAVTPVNLRRDADVPIAVAVAPTEISEKLTARQRLARDTNFTEEELQHFLDTLRERGQCLIYGPTSTGKTFLARHLARYVAGANGFIEHLHMHPGYRYEDFVERVEGDAIHPGRFIDFLARAARIDGPAVMIIDDLQRADIARVMGEILQALETVAKPSVSQAEQN
jgi:hypothetical protein